MPAMLQLLQSKQFGTHRLPEGWVIAAAGNPPAYNESARTFDTVTMDRVRLLQIEADYHVWRDYAHEKGLHPAVLSYLELNPEHFSAWSGTCTAKLCDRARVGRICHSCSQATSDWALRYRTRCLESFCSTRDCRRVFKFLSSIYRLSGANQPCEHSVGAGDSRRAGAAGYGL